LFPGLSYKKYSFDVEKAKSPQRAMNLEQFVRSRKKDKPIWVPGAEGGGKEIQSLLFIDNQMPPFQSNPELQSDVRAPFYMDNFSRLMRVGFSYWQDFKRKPEFNRVERIVCLTKGAETFRLVAPIFKNNIYAGVYDDLDPMETPINFFETDPAKISKYKLMQISDVYQAELTRGQCLYIPAYYWF
jgi:hypothetical protein